MILLWDSLLSNLFNCNVQWKILLCSSHLHAYSNYGMRYCRVLATAVPAPFVVIALITLGTGQNFLISEGNL